MKKPFIETNKSIFGWQLGFSLSQTNYCEHYIQIELYLIKRFIRIVI